MFTFTVDSLTQNQKFTAHALLYVNIPESQRETMLTKIQALAFPVAAVRADMILSFLHLKAAVFKASENYLSKKMKTRTLETEVFYALTPHEKINLAFRDFGISPSTDAVLILCFNDDSDELPKIKTTLNSIFSVDPVENESLLTELSKVTNKEHIRKVFKAEDVPEGNNLLSNQVLSSIANKWVK